MAANYPSLGVIDKIRKCEYRPLMPRGRKPRVTLEQFRAAIRRDRESSLADIAARLGISRQRATELAKLCNARFVLLTPADKIVSA